MKIIITKARDVLILGYNDIKDAIDSEKWICHRDGVRTGTDKLTLNTNSVNVSAGGKYLFPEIIGEAIDLHDPDSVKWHPGVIEENGIIVRPGDFYLMHVRERFECSAPLFIHGRDRYFAPMIEGRSSGGRTALSIHKTAGVGEWFFKANFTTEVSTDRPVRIRPGDEIGQILFEEVSCASEGYNSVYSDQYDEPRAPVLGRDRFQRHK